MSSEAIYSRSSPCITVENNPKCSLSKNQLIISALVIIVILGSLAATGALFPHIGYASFSFMGVAALMTGIVGGPFLIRLIKNQTCGLSSNRESLSIEEEDTKIIIEPNPDKASIVKSSEFIRPLDDSDEEYIQKLAHEQDLFKQGALSHIKLKSEPINFELSVNLTEQEQATLLEAYKIKRRVNHEQYKISKGGEHFVIQLTSLPDVVFKYPIKSSDQEAQIDGELKIFEHAFNTVFNEELNLIKIPPCGKYEAISGNEKIYFLVQQKLSTNGDFDFQKGLYRFALDDPDLQSFMRECFLQLTKFICLTDFADVVYHNMPLLLNGEGIGLYDLDRKGAITGLFQGCIVGRHAGLFKYIPSMEFLNEITGYISNLEIADPEFKNSIFDKWNVEKDKYRAGIERREKKRKKMHQYLVNAGITSARQELDPSKIPYEENPEARKIQELIISAINEHIRKSYNFDLVQSRAFSLNLGVIENDHLDELDFCVDFTRAAKLILKDLKQKGVIARFKYNSISHKLNIKC